MKKILIGLLLTGFLFVGAMPAEAYVSVKGYYRSNGTYVAPYVRSNPNGLKYDNYGYKPSDGLYNKTYGTRGATWDTPTYITDPYYYQGKALYESGSTDSVYTPTYTPSYRAPVSSSYYNYLLDDLPKSEKPTRKIGKRISSIVKEWSDEHPFTDCRDAPLVGKDKKVCQSYRDTNDDDRYYWSETSSVASQYTTCDAGKNYYYAPAACGKGQKVICQGGKAMCQAK